MKTKTLSIFAVMITVLVGLMVVVIVDSVDTDKSMQTLIRRTFVRAPAVQDTSSVSTSLRVINNSVSTSLRVAE